MRSWTILAAAVFASVLAGEARAAFETYVSATGTDVGGCTRAAPCATFAFAQGQTLPGGTIACVDAGSFGPVSITKSITIDCGGTLGRVTPTGIVSAIDVNTAGVVVRLRNLTIDGQQHSNFGIEFRQGSALFIENCAILNATVAGIAFRPSGGGTLYVKDTLISKAGTGALVETFGGLNVTVRGTIERTTVTENDTRGISAVSGGPSGSGVISLQIRDSTVSGAASAGIHAQVLRTDAIAAITVDRSASILNGLEGVLADGAGSYILLGNSTVISNGTGLKAINNGRILSYQNNQMSGNVSEGTAASALSIR